MTFKQFLMLIILSLVSMRLEARSELEEYRQLCRESSAGVVFLKLNSIFRAGIDTGVESFFNKRKIEEGESKALADERVQELKRIRNKPLAGDCAQYFNKYQEFDLFNPKKPSASEADPQKVLKEEIRSYSKLNRRNSENCERAKDIGRLRSLMSHSLDQQIGSEDKTSDQIRFEMSLKINESFGFEGPVNKSKRCLQGLTDNNSKFFRAFSGDLDEESWLEICRTIQQISRKRIRVLKDHCYRGQTETAEQKKRRSQCELGIDVEKNCDEPVGDNRAAVNGGTEKNKGRPESQTFVLEPEPTQPASSTGF